MINGYLTKTKELLHRLLTLSKNAKSINIEIIENRIEIIRNEITNLAYDICINYKCISTFKVARRLIFYPTIANLRALIRHFEKNISNEQN